NRIIQNSSSNPKATKQTILIKAKLTKREKQIIKLLCEGKSCNAISKELLISYHTVDSHRKNIERKIGVNSIASIVKFAVENDLSD
ncbi:MAG: response regulator transcription factor, partial [Bacteroidota bacterium]